jgi:hypothetical protein
MAGFGKASSLVQLADDFDREGNLSDDPRWTAQSGSMSISNGLLTPGGSGNILLTDKGTRDTTWKVVFSTVDSAGQWFRIVLNWVDSNNYYYARVGFSSITVVEVISGTSSTVGSIPLSTAYRGSTTVLYVMSRWVDTFVTTVGHADSISNVDSSLVGSNKSGIIGESGGSNVNINLFSMTG